MELLPALTGGWVNRLDRPAAITLAAGFLLVAALFAGNLFKSMGLPRLTGYLATGVLVGPQVLALVTEQILLELRIFNGVAIAMIALTAGTKMDIRNMRPLLRGIAWISAVGVVGTVVLLSLSAYLLADLLPFTAGLAELQKMALAMVLGVTMSAQSPAVVVALRKETDADAPLRERSWASSWYRISSLYCCSPSARRWLVQYSDTDPRRVRRRLPQ